jgi:hypothetical protein
VVEHLQVVDELAAGVRAILELEAQERAHPAREVGLGAPLGLAVHQRRVDHLGDLGMLGEMLGH